MSHRRDLNRAEEDGKVVKRRRVRGGEWHATEQTPLTQATDPGPSAPTRESPLAAAVEATSSGSITKHGKKKPAAPGGGFLRISELSQVTAPASLTTADNLPPPNPSTLDAADTIASPGPEPDVDVAMLTVDDDEAVPTFDPSKRKRHQGQSQYISDVQKLLPEIQSLILATCAHEKQGETCRCGQAAPYRCMDCFNGPLCCFKCIVACHINNPFHRIEEWNGQMFVRNKMFDENDPSKSITLSMHASGLPCENRSAISPPRRMLFVDHNGFHQRFVHFCHCKRVYPWKQLVSRRLFPATFKEPRTAFTFTVLKQFHVHSLASKKSAFDFVRALGQLTNNSDPGSVQARYKEFVLAYRLWEHLVIQRRAGQALVHSIDRHIPTRRKGCLTLRCPCCPEVGFNVSEAEIRAATENDRHKYTLFVSADGNFKLQRKKKKDDPDDFALNDGNAHFVPTAEYKVYMEDIAKEVEEANDGTCPHLKAGRMHNVVKFKNSVVSGVVAIQCARHGFFLPQGIVDLPRGEGHKLADFALCYALAEASALRWIFLTYDIWCKFSKYLVKRFRKRFPRMAPVAEKTDGAIGKGHNRGHGDDCRDGYNLNFTPHVGLVSGEIIETSWAELNLSAGSTREMNEGHRHDALDAVCDHWNWGKLVRIAEALLDKYRDARSLVRARTVIWELVDSKQRSERPEAVEQWEAAGITPQTDPSNPTRKLRVFHPNFEKAPPTTQAAYNKMLAAERGTEHDGNEGPLTPEDMHSKDVRLIQQGLSIDEDRQQMRRLLASPRTAQHQLRTERHELYTKLMAYRDVLLKRIPALQERMTDIDFDEPEKASILLPSDFSSQDRESLKLEALGQVELELRREQAFQGIHDLKDRIQLRNFAFREKKSHANGVHGVAANTRAAQYLTMLKDNIEAAGETYRRHYHALRALGLSKDDTSLRPITRKDQWGKDGLNPELGDSRKPDPWFWHTQRPAELDEKAERAWETELERVRWYRARALKERAQEEVEILEAEFKRAATSFEKTADIWTTMAKGAPAADSYGDTHGWRAYAHKQAAVYRGLRENCVKKWEEAGKLVKDDEECVTGVSFGIAGWVLKHVGGWLSPFQLARVYHLAPATFRGGGGRCIGLAVVSDPEKEPRYSRMPGRWRIRDK